MANDLDNAITNEPVRKCLFCGHALNKRSKIAISLSSVTLTIIGIIIIVALIGPLSQANEQHDCNWRCDRHDVVCEWKYYDANGDEVDSRENWEYYEESCSQFI